MDWRIAGNAGTVVEPIGVALKPSCGCRAQPPVRTPGAGTGQREQCRYRHGQRLIALEKRLAKTEPGAGAFAMDNSGSDFPYSQANHLLEQGLDVEEVARRCGLSRAEVSLLGAMAMAPQR